VKQYHHDLALLKMELPLPKSTTSTAGFVMLSVIESTSIWRKKFVSTVKAFCTNTNVTVAASSLLERDDRMFHYDGLSASLRPPAMETDERRINGQ
jgi:hypothetical protein